MTTLLLTMALVLLLAWPLGRYMAVVLAGGKAPLDTLFLPVERGIYRLLGPAASGGMSWRGCALAFLASNAALGVLVWMLFMAQGVLPLNPDHAPGMSWDLALHTMISFLTNTNQQHYSGQAQLSYLSQMVGIVGLQVVTPMFGLAILAATLRGLFGGRGDVPRIPGADAGAAAHGAQAETDVGNYWRDTVRAGLRIMLPLCLLWSLLLTWQGVPSTLAPGTDVTPIDASAGQASQHIPVGPVAPMVAAKQLGTNGGGWYGPNGNMALENPTPLSNLLETIALILLPAACCFMLTPFTGRRRLGALVLSVMLGLSLLSSIGMLTLEHSAAPQDSAIVMEGKELRHGVDGSAVYGALTTQASNGSINAMFDSDAPLTGGIAMVNMLINAIWGGIGCGVLGMLVYILLAVFLAGLMTGRTPELFGRKIEGNEVRWLALLILLQPLTVLGMTAVTLAVPGLAGTTNPGAHAISQVFYEYTSAFANNGSGFEGLSDNSVWWNLSTSLALLLGRLPALLVPLLIAGSMARKRAASDSDASLRLESPTFALTLVAIIAILTVLQFLPALVLGPVADQLQLTHSMEVMP